MKTIKKCLLTSIMMLMGLMTFPMVFANWWNNFDSALQSSTKSIETHLDAKVDAWLRKTTASNIIKKVVDVVFSVMIVVWILIAVIWFYEVLTSSDEKKVQEGIKTIIYWVIWIIIMFSAKYLSTVIFEDLFFSWWAQAITEVKPLQLLTNIYNKMVYPFIKLAIYLSLWILVILMMVRVFTYITAQDDSTKKKSMWIIVRTIVGTLFITWAKHVVESIYGKQTDLLTNLSQYQWKNLGELDSTLLDPSNIPVIYGAINWALWLLSFALLVIILFQTYKMLTKPDDEATYSSLKKTIIYAVCWIILIGAAYLLANVFIIK